MVWGGICASGKTPLIFIERNVKINAKAYQNIILKGVLEPWAKKHFGNKRWTLQQDMAPAHSAQTTMDLCGELFPRFWGKKDWPPNSPDLNPMDYSVWGILEEKISRKSYATLDQLKYALRKAWDEIEVETLQKIIKNFPKRLKACIEAKGGQFEHML
jgi:hypothetical protein